MSNKGPIQTKIQLRRDTSANWNTNNPILAAGELGVDTTLNRVKIGDGTTTWNNLPFIDTQVQIVRW